MTDTAKESIRSLEVEVGVELGFFESLLDEPSDWSFVIKLHAIFEAAVAFCLAEELGRRELVDVFTYTELSRDKTGKVAIADALGLFTKRERRFLRSLSELRNRLVHDVSNTRFSFETHLSEMTPEQRSAFYQRFELDIEQDYVEVGDEKVPREEVFLQHPRFGIWVCAMVLLEYLYQHKELTRARRELEAERSKFYLHFRNGLLGSGRGEMRDSPPRPRGLFDDARSST